MSKSEKYGDEGGKGGWGSEWKRGMEAGAKGRAGRFGGRRAVGFSMARKSRLAINSFRAFVYFAGSIRAASCVSRHSALSTSKFARPLFRFLSFFRPSLSPFAFFFMSRREQPPARTYFSMNRQTDGRGYAKLHNI